MFTIAQMHYAISVGYCRAQAWMAALARSRFHTYMENREKILSYINMENTLYDGSNQKVSSLAKQENHQFAS